MTVPPRLNLEETICETDYFRGCLESLLSLIHPMSHCLDLIIKILLNGPDGCGKRMVAKMAAKNLGITFYEERVADMFDENIIGTEKKVRAAFTKFPLKEPCLFYVTGYEIFCLLDPPDLDRIELCIQECLDELCKKSEQPMIFIASTNNFDRVFKTPLSAVFHHSMTIKCPTFSEAQEIVEVITKSKSLPISDGDYIGNLVNSIVKSEINGTLVPSLDEDKTYWMDIGGLTEIKTEIIDAIQLSLRYPQLKMSGGVLLFGPPGTGKTLLARAVATECGLSFFNVRGPELLNEYVGQSEKNIRNIFERARESSPSVIFFDEIDSLAPNRGQAGDSAGVMDRIVSQLLAELDGFGKTGRIFVIGATNRVDLIDPSLLRSGRFNRVLEVGPPRSSGDRLEVLRALTRKMALADDVNLLELEQLARPNMSGADFQALCSRALQKSFDRCVELVEAGVGEEDVEIVTKMQDFLESLNPE